MTLDGPLATARSHYRKIRPKSAAAADGAKHVLPGGNTRSVLDFRPFPFRVATAEGPWLTDLDGHRYLDLLGNYSAGLFGHTPAIVSHAVTGAMRNGWSLGAGHPREARLARLLVDRFPSLEQVRFTNSGTEANLMAIATALHATGRSKVLVSDGGYHGGVLYFGVSGAPLLVPHEWVRMTFNDVESVERAFADHGDEIGCVLVEPMLGASGCFPARREFLEALRERSTHHGAVLVFDEVMTSRLSPGGAQALVRITPEMTTLGKYLAGGMTFGAFGGKRSLMEAFDPEGGALSHGGTFNNNVATMAGGIAALERLCADDLVALNLRGDRLRTKLNGIFAEDGLPMSVTGWGSLMNVHAVPGAPESPADLAAADDRIKELFFFDMLGAGYYFARRGYLSLSLEVSDAHLDGFVEAVAEWAARRGSMLR